MKYLLEVLTVSLCLWFPSANAQGIWLDQLALSAMDAGWGSPHANASVEGNPLSVAGQKFQHGVGTHAVSHMRLDLNGNATRFTASVGVDDEAQKQASIEFYILGDKKILWQSGVMKKGETAKKADVNITGIQKLGLLVSDAGDGIDYDHADWCDAKLECTSEVTPKDLTRSSSGASSSAEILTPKPPETPRINGAKVYGVRPGHPVLFKIAATGKRPMSFSADGLPQGLSLDASSGIITGSVGTAGEYRVRLTARNDLGKADRELRIVVGPTICLTPPMGWNSWNCWACAVDDRKVRAAANAFVSTGLINHGWTNINIDDCWEVKPNSNDPILGGKQRNNDGMINTNRKFPDMKALANYVHSQGLKLGIYSSPGPLTCAGYTASYQYEEKDALQYSNWGIDYLKYDWCSYGELVKSPTLADFKKPYTVMRAALNKVQRDIVFSLCQYGMGNVWEWGGEVGGNCWRTTGDISDSWGSMAGIGFSQAGHENYAKPGNWNDPDMLVVGLVGWGPDLHPTNLKPNEQYTHISLWCLLSAPLLIGCDLSRIDDFTMNLLTNDEVIAVNQDPLGKQAGRVSKDGGREVWAKEMEDGSRAVGLFFVGEDTKDPVKGFPWDEKGSDTISVRASDVGIKGKFSVRDLWREKDLGVFED
ncbi:MAG TPA: NPCBM/NEW2 domain-containing protein, partial [Bacteroidota bacterium]